MTNETLTYKGVPVLFEEALCPDCGFAATYVSGIGGWLFHCKPCERSWGHPQLMKYDEATALLAMAQKNEEPRDLEQRFPIKDY